MRIYRVQGPDGRIYRFEGPDDATPDQITAAVAAQFGGQQEEPPAPTPPGPQPQEGFMPALKAGVSGIKSDVAALAGRTGLMGLPEAEAYIAKQKAYQDKTYRPTEKGWTEAPLTKIGELAGGSLPYMAAPILAGLAAPEALGVGALGLGAEAVGAGLASATQFAGSNLSRQTDEGKKLGETNLAAAALAAIPQAALDTFSLHMMPGIGKMFEKAGVDLSEKAARNIAEQGLAKTITDYTLATGKTMGAEGLTEAGQQVFERLQAGLNITDPEAQKEYFDNFIGGAVLGGVIAPGGHYLERGDEQARFNRQQAQAAQPAQPTQPATPTEPAPPAAQTPEQIGQIANQIAQIAQNAPTERVPLQKAMEMHDLLTKQYDDLKTQYTTAAQNQDTETVRKLRPQLEAMQANINKSEAYIDRMGGTTKAPEELETGHQAALANIDKHINTASKKLVEATQNDKHADVDKYSAALDKLKSDRDSLIQTYTQRSAAARQKADNALSLTQRGQTRDLFTEQEAPVPKVPQAPLSKYVQDQGIKLTDAQKAEIDAAPTAQATLGPTTDEVKRKLAIAQAEHIGAQIAQLKTETDNAMAQGRGYLTDTNRNIDPDTAAKFAQMKALQEQFDGLTERYMESKPAFKAMGLFDPNNVLRTAAQNNDIDAINRITKQREAEQTAARNKERDVAKLKAEELVASLDDRLGLAGQKSTRLTEGPVYDKLVKQIQDIMDSINLPQGKGRSVYQRLQDIAAEHAEKQAIYNDTNADSRKRAGALKRMNTLVEQFNNLVETKTEPAIKQIEKLHTQFRKVEPAEKVSKIKEAKKAEGELNATVSALMGQKSREAAQAAKINAGDIRSLIEPSKEFKELGILLGRESDAYKAQMADMQKRLKALKEKYGADDKAVIKFKDEATKALGETALKEGRKTPEYQETLKQRIEDARESYASAGKQEVKSKRTGQETKKVRHAPRELLNQLHKDFEEGIRSEREGSLYRVNESAGPAMREEEVKRLISRITDSWKTVPTIVFARDFDALPQHIKDQAIKDEVAYKIPGVYDPDEKTVYIVGDQMHTAEDVVATIAHEIAGHFGLREMLGNRYNQTMNDLYSGNAAVRDAADEKLKNSKNLSREVAVEEVLAEMAEKPTNTAAERSALQRVFDFIKTFFNRMFRGQVINDDAVRQIVANANRYVVEGTRPEEYQNVGVYTSAKGESLFRTKKEPTAYGASFIAKEQNAKDKMLGNIMGLTGRVQFVDRFAALSEALKKGMDANVIDSLEAQNAEYFLRYGQNRSQLAGQALTNGNIQIREGKGGGYIYESVKGPNMMDVAEALEKGKFASDTEAEAILTAYIAGQRADVVGWDKLNYKDTAKVKQEHAEIMAMLNANGEKMHAVREAARIYQQYNNGLIDFVTQAGYLTKERAAELKSVPYIPFYRVNNEGNVELMLDAKSSIRIGNLKDEPQLHELVGDNKHIMPIFASAVQNTFMLTDMALRNKTIQESAFLLHKMGIASVISKGLGPTGPSTVRFHIKGVPHFVTIDKDKYGIPAELIVKGLEGIKTTMPALVQMMGAPANLLRNFIVRNPAYAVRQVIRDPLTAWMTTGTDATPVLSSMKELAKMVAGRSEEEAKLMASGAISSNVFTGDQRDMSKFLKEISTGKSGWAKAMAKLDAFALQGDAATRAVVYKDSLDKGMSEQAALLRTLESMNFGRRGLSPSVQWLNTMIPFFNAQIQGLDVLYRAFKGDMPYSEQLEIRKKMVARGLMLAAGSLAYAAMMQDDEAYKRATPDQRLGNWFVYIPGVDEPLKVPVPFELGYLFKSLPEAVFNVAANDEKAQNAIGGMLTLLDQSNPFQLPAAIKPATEVVLGKSFFGGDLESAREKKMLASDRYRDTSTEAAKLIAQLTGAEEIRKLTGHEGLSAISIDHLIRGYTGGLGVALVQLANPLLNSELPANVAKPSTPLSKEPFIGGLFQPVQGRGTLDEAYNQMEYIQQIKGTFDDMIARGQKAEARAFAQDHVAEMAVVSVSGAVQKQLGELAKQERMIKASPNLTTERKDEILKRLDLMKQKIARGSMAVYDKTKDQTDRS